jgi:hypothetical protein
VLDLALIAPRREVGAYASFKKLASGAFATLREWRMLFELEKFEKNSL